MTVLLAAALGLLSWWGRYELRVAPCEALTGQKLTVTGRVTEYPQVSEDYSRVTVRLTEGAPGEKAWLYLYHGELPRLRPGDLISGEIKAASVMDRGGARMHTATSAGICLRGYFTGEVTVTGRDRTAWRYFPQEISRTVKEACERLFSGRTAVFMEALLTGDKQALYDDVELYESMRQSGVLHAVAVSGMHVFVIICFLEMLFGRGRRTSLLCLPVMALFVLMSGGGASVVRAALMQTIYMAAPMFGREGDSSSGLSAALLFLLLLNPMAVGGVGLQLSFACRAGYAVFLPGVVRQIGGRRLLRRSRLADHILGSLGNTFCATVFSIPIAAFYFGAVPLLSPLANLVTLPVIEVCFAGGYVLCALSALVPPLAAAGAAVLSLGVRWCTGVYGVLGRAPFACLYTADPLAAGWLVFAYVLLAAWLILRRRGVKIMGVLPVELGIIGLCAVLLSGSVRLALGRREIDVLDVGQGECVLCLDRDGAVVVDCGGSELYNAGDAAADRLLAAGKRRVDALILTHLHEDHANGAETLLYRMPVDRLILPADADGNERLTDRLLSMAERRGTEVVYLSEPMDGALGDLSLSLVLPRTDGDDNERGIVVEAAYPGLSALIMGDGGVEAEMDLLARGFLRDTDVLVVGHHGSKSASGPLFLNTVRPELAVISVGYNSYGQPAEEILDRLERYGAQVLRTDRDGTVVLPGKRMD